MIKLAQKLTMLLALPLAMSAATITWNFTGTDDAGTIGNSRTWTSGGVTVTATAWSLTGNSGTTLAQGALGRWSTGLGVCSAIEGAGCNSPEHQIDNNGNYDFVLFQFSSAVDVVSMVLDPAGAYDSDISWYTGTNAGGLSLTGKTLANLNSSPINFGGVFNDVSAVAQDLARTATINANGITTLLVGGTTLSGYTGNDYFKLTSLTANTVAPPPIGNVPEPSTYAMMGAGIIALLMANKLRQR